MVIKKKFIEDSIHKCKSQKKIMDFKEIKQFQ